MLAVCNWCGTDEYVEIDPGTRLAMCTGPGHADTRLWVPPTPGPGSPDNKAPETLADKLGIYNDLPQCLVTGAWAETGVIEHRYRTMFRDKYKVMASELSGSQRPFESAYIGSRLGDLSRGPGVAYREVQGSGYFHARVGSWTAEPIDEGADEISWATYAVSLGLDPDVRPSRQPIHYLEQEDEAMTDIRSTEPNTTGHRRARFRQGWAHASDGREYGEDVLSLLTWQNAGWRMGQLFGDTSPDLIDEAYAWAVRQQVASGRSYEDE